MVRKWFFLLVGLFASSAWSMEDVVERGAIRFKMLVTLLDASEYFDYSEQSTALALNGQAADLEESSLTLAVEYGIGEGMSAIFATGYLRRDLENSTGRVENSGVDGVYLGLRQRLGGFTGGTRFMAETGVWLPAEADNVEALPIGSESIDWVSVVSYNQDFLPHEGGMSMDFGYRFRNEGPSNEVFFDAELRLRLFGVGLLHLKYHTFESQDDDRVPFGVLEYPLSRGGQLAGLALSKRFGRRLKMELGFRDQFKGRNQADIDGFYLGLDWRP